MAEYDGISQFRKVAPRHLRDAEELLQPPSLAPQERGAAGRHLRAAVYLAGYAVECILKAYVISRQPSATTLTQAVEARRAAGEGIPNVLGAEGHRLPLLLSLTDLEAILATDHQRQRDWGICSKWKVSWRYDPNLPTASFAVEFVGATRDVYQWIQRQL